MSHGGKSQRRERSDRPSALHVKLSWEKIERSPPPRRVVDRRTCISRLKGRKVSVTIRPTTGIVSLFGERDFGLRAHS
ncbi:hypothetical protein R1flu_014058 [Riccia fluitans]|uniref:Ribosomal protein S12 n=1 Tax=Riccia fluitans TaxID=41844 RepID=A0ABD1YF50_9MARC